MKVVTLLTERYGIVLKKRGRKMWLAEIYRSLAVYDRGLQSPGLEKGDQSDSIDNTEESGSREAIAQSNKELGFAIDKPEDGFEDGNEMDEDDELVLAALDSMDASEVFKHGEQSNLHHSVIPSDNFLKLLQLLLLIAPMEPQDAMSTYASQLSEKRLKRLRETAGDILASFNVEKNHGISFRTFETVITAAIPNMFNSLGPLFEHFLFAKDMDLSKRKTSIDPANGSAPLSPVASATPSKSKPPPVPVLKEEGDILDLAKLSQLSFIFKSPTLFRHMRPLYSGNTSGFSMGSFEKSVFKWRSPTILIVSGSLLPPEPSNARERALADSIPQSSRLSPSISHDSTQTLVYGAYIPSPWKQTHKTCFGDAETKLFQLSPIHDVFHASKMSSDYTYFNRSPTYPSGLGFGTQIPQQLHQSFHTTRLGPVSLHLDDALEFGIFTHISEGGGSFHSSSLPARRHKDWQDRFEIEALEVWGIGGDEEAEQQRKDWAWEEREAEARRRINLGTGDIEADRELMRMAGLIGGNRSGGSMT